MDLCKTFLNGFINDLCKLKLYFRTTYVRFLQMSKSMQQYILRYTPIYLYELLKNPGKLDCVSSIFILKLLV